MDEKDSLKETIAVQLRSLMDQADLTIEGLSEAAGLSTHTIAKILTKKTNVSPKSIHKLTKLFSISAAELMSPSKIVLNKQAYPEMLENFNRSYEANLKYFGSKAKENTVAHFVKTTLINDPYLNKGRRVKEVAEYIRKNPKYQKDFDPKVIGKALERMWKAGIINREDRTGRGSVYFYSRKN